MHPPLQKYYWLIMTASTKMMRTICKKITSSAFSGLDFRRNMTILNRLFGLLRLKRAPVSGLDLWRLSLGMCLRISRWSVGIPSLVRKDLMPIYIQTPGGDLISHTCMVSYIATVIILDILQMSVSHRVLQNSYILACKFPIQNSGR